MTTYCTCDSPVMDVEHDAGCRRCGRPVDFSPRFMTVTVSDEDGATLARFEARAFDAFDSSPDHFDLIAPAYLAPLSAGAPSVLVTYSRADDVDEWTFTERHTACGWRDGEVVGTSVEVVNS